MGTYTTFTCTEVSCVEKRITISRTQMWVRNGCDLATYYQILPYVLGTLLHGVCVVVKRWNPSRMAQNLKVFGWNLDDYDHTKIATMPRFRLHDGTDWINQTTSPYRSPKDLFDCWSDWTIKQDHEECSTGKHADYCGFPSEGVQLADNSWLQSES